MQMLLRTTRRASARVSVLPPFAKRTSALRALALATGLVSAALFSGCASKTPLIVPPASATVPSAPVSSNAGTPGAANLVSDSAVAANRGLQRSTPSRARRFLGIFSPYRIDIPQGNFVSEEMLAQLKVGMTPDQVRFALGTPLITDIFHAERWDYVFRMLKTNDEVLSSRVTVFFKEGRLSRFEGGNLPTEVDYLALIAGAVPKKIVEAAPRPAVAPSAAKTNP